MTVTYFTTNAAILQGCTLNIYEQTYSMYIGMLLSHPTSVYCRLLYVPLIRRRGEAVLLLHQTSQVVVESSHAPQSKPAFTTCACIHTPHTKSHKHASTHAHTHTHAYTHTRAHTHTHTRTHACTRACTHCKIH